MNQFEIVELAQTGHDDEWQTYVNRAPNASLYHGLEWRDVFSRSFGHRSCYLKARDKTGTRGVLPLVEMQSMLFGHFFVSLPFFNYGGIVADSQECEAALAVAAAGIANKRGAHHIELRQSFAAASLVEDGWMLRQHKAALVVPLDPDPGTHWSSLSSRLRGKIRKAEGAGTSFSVKGSDGLDEFFRVFALNMRDLGTPVHSPAFFKHVINLAKDAKILLAHRDGRPVAGAIALHHRGRIELPWICSDYTERSFNVNEFLYWKSIEWACLAGAREIDLGRSSTDAGTYKFKLQWNPQVHPLFWYYWLASGAELPELNPHNPKYEFAIRCWKKMPVSLANKVGPWIIRNIP